MTDHPNYNTMAANTKFQPVPQRDSLEDQHHFSQPPPAYEAEASTNAALLSGVARGEDDNLPDDFKVGDCFPKNAHDLCADFISLAASSPKRPSTSAWPLCARSTLS